MIPILTQVASLASTWFEGQAQKSAAKTAADVAMKQAEAEVFKRKATSDADWDLESMRGSQNSWKDEYLTLVLSIPLILCFIPGMEEVVKNGFQQLDSIPDWYKASFAVVVSASFGVRNLLKIWRK